MHKKGFTVAEVLIALAVLSIVGGALIYSVINLIPQQQTYTTQKAPVTLSEGVKTLLSDEKTYPTKELDKDPGFCRSYTKLFKGPDTVDCSVKEDIAALRQSALADGIPEAAYTNANLVTSTGEVWWGLNQQFEGDNPIVVMTDVDGKEKGNNKLGEDIVAMSLYKNGKIGVYEEQNKNYTPEKAPDIGSCRALPPSVEHNLGRDSEQFGVAHFMSYKEGSECSGDETPTFKPEVRIECPTVPMRKFIVFAGGNSQEAISTLKSGYVNMAREYYRTCPTLPGKIQEALNKQGITANEKASIPTDTSFKQKPYGRAHFGDEETCNNVERRSVLVNTNVLAFMENKALPAKGKSAIWAIPMLNERLSISNSSQNISACGDATGPSYKLQGSGHALRMQDENLKLIKDNSGSNVQFENLACGYNQVCNQIKRDCSNTKLYSNYLEYDVPYAFGEFEKVSTTSCSSCTNPARAIVKVGYDEGKRFICKNNGIGCTNDNSNTIYKILCTQSRRVCDNNNFSSQFPADGNMNLGHPPYDYGGSSSSSDCVPCSMSERHYLKTNSSSNKGIDISANKDFSTPGHFKYMSACSQMSRNCNDDDKFNVGFMPEDKNKNLLGCVGCYSENSFRSVNGKRGEIYAKCQASRTCSAADEKSKSNYNYTYARYSAADVSSVPYDCACEELTGKQTGYTFNYCSSAVGLCNGKNSEGESSYTFDAKINEKDIKKDVYTIRRSKSENRLPTDDQLKDDAERENYRPLEGNLTEKENNIDRYFLLESCAPSDNFNCTKKGSYNPSTHSFNVEISIKTKCAEGMKCTESDANSSGSVASYCRGDADKWEGGYDYKWNPNCGVDAYGQPSGCPEKEWNPRKTPTHWKSNNNCKKTVAVQDSYEAYNIKYTWADPQCSRSLTVPDQNNCNCKNFAKGTSCCEPVCEAKNETVSMTGDKELWSVGPGSSTGSYNTVVNKITKLGESSGVKSYEVTGGKITDLVFHFTPCGLDWHKNADQNSKNCNLSLKGNVNCTNFKGNVQDATLYVMNNEKGSTSSTSTIGNGKLIQYNYLHSCSFDFPIPIKDENAVSNNGFTIFMTAPMLTNCSGPDKGGVYTCKGSGGGKGSVYSPYDNWGVINVFASYKTVVENGCTPASFKPIPTPTPPSVDPAPPSGTNEVALPVVLLVGGQYFPQTSDYDWIKGRQQDYGTHKLTDDTGNGQADASNPCTSKHFSASDLGIGNKTISKCTVGTNYGKDWSATGNTQNSQGQTKYLCGSYSSSCNVDSGGKGITVKLCTRYHTYSDCSKAADFDDWGIGSVNLTVSP